MRSCHAQLVVLHDPYSMGEMKQAFASWKSRRNLWEGRLLLPWLKWSQVKTRLWLEKCHGTFNDLPSCI